MRPPPETVAFSKPFSGRKRSGNRLCCTCLKSLSRPSSPSRWVDVSCAFRVLSQRSGSSHQKVLQLVVVAVWHLGFGVVQHRLKGPSVMASPWWLSESRRFVYTMAKSLSAGKTAVATSNDTWGTAMPAFATTLWAIAKESTLGLKLVDEGPTDTLNPWPRNFRSSVGVFCARPPRNRCGLSSVPTFDSATQMPGGPS